MGTKTNNPLLSLHHEMDKFEAVYLELHTHMAAKIPLAGEHHPPTLTPTPNLTTYTPRTDHLADTNSSDSLVYTHLVSQPGLPLQTGTHSCTVPYSVKECPVQCPGTVTQCCSTFHNPCLHHPRIPSEPVQEGIHHLNLSDINECPTKNQDSKCTNFSDARCEFIGARAWRFCDGKRDCIGLGTLRSFSATDSHNPSSSSVSGKDQSTCEELWIYLTTISLIFNRMRYFLVSENIQ
ncbi:hypothetical protein Pcinc_034156 [Petrolisthes cinctipes]|uniref:Uncharacterized protein n=1 Tax=Petrolisthes cinctipes TaxID=88211 RepID=A0AAE1JX96_PETCI|nr:hypothetical protein Pcinc_034156 [Petrolisthes cinctipes]